MLCFFDLHTFEGKKKLTADRSFLREKEKKKKKKKNTQYSSQSNTLFSLKKKIVELEPQEKLVAHFLNSVKSKKTSSRKPINQYKSINKNDFVKYGSFG